MQVRFTRGCSLPPRLGRVSFRATCACWLPDRTVSSAPKRSSYFDGLGSDVIGVDNNMRADFFGPDGDTRWNQQRLERDAPRRFSHLELDIRDRDGVLELLASEPFDLIVHCAAQPSHDLAAQMPFEDFDVNAVGTLNLLEGLRRHAPEAVVHLMSTNKVYGDAPNELPLTELETRWDYAEPEDCHGIAETCRIDRCLHSLFGASKVAADVMAQEYGRYFGLKVGVFRGGCLTGPAAHRRRAARVPRYLVKAALERHAPTGSSATRASRSATTSTARDVLRAIHRFFEAPRPGEVYNLGGGRENSCSILEAADTGRGARRRAAQDRVRRRRRAAGDHICYISDLPSSKRTSRAGRSRSRCGRSFSEIIDSWRSREPARSAR